MHRGGRARLNTSNRTVTPANHTEYIEMNSPITKLITVSIATAMQSWGFPKLEEFNTFDNIHAGDIFSNFGEQIKLSPLHLLFQLGSRHYFDTRTDLPCFRLQNSSRFVGSPQFD